MTRIMPPTDGQLAAAAVYDTLPVTLHDLVEHARTISEWCCDLGCGTGACETCPCCNAGWCVTGTDELPTDPEDQAHWLAAAAEHNPIAALAASLLLAAQGDDEP